VAEAIGDMKRDIQDGAAEAGALSKEQLTKLIGFIEAIMVGFFPTFLSVVVYRAMGSEKLVEFVEDLGSDASTSVLFRLLCLFVLLELNAARGLERLRKFTEQNDAQDWMFIAVTQRLFAFYMSRPLSSQVQGQFENLVADLQIKLAGGKSARIDKGKAIAKIKRQIFQDKEGD
jgi:hypothetical protein